jgi:hypothetical protein
MQLLPFDNGMGIVEFLRERQVGPTSESSDIPNYHIEKINQIEYYGDIKKAPTPGMALQNQV